MLESFSARRGLRGRWLFVPVFLIVTILAISSLNGPHDFDLIGDNDSVFSHPHQLKVNDSRCVHIAVVLKDLAKDTAWGLRLRVHFRSLLKSVVSNSEKRPVHFIFITDRDSAPTATKMFKEALPADNEVEDDDGSQAEAVKSGALLERFSLDLVDVTALVSTVEPWTATMKAYFNHHGESYFILNYDGKNGTIQVSFAERYNDPIYYLSPFYHVLFPHLGRLLAVDADVIFHCDAAKLFEEFAQFEAENVIGSANDLSPHYHQMLTGYRGLHPDTILGTPGRFQGLNMGVLLLDLNRMRNSKDYNEYLSAEGTSKVARKYLMTRTFLGAQDWFTLVSFDRPELVYPLSCLYNRQLSRDYESPPWSDLFPYFHECEKEGETALVVHGNSDSTLANDIKEVALGMVKADDNKAK